LHARVPARSGRATFIMCAALLGEPAPSRAHTGGSVLRGLPFLLSGNLARLKLEWAVSTRRAFSRSCGLLLVSGVAAAVVRCAERSRLARHCVPAAISAMAAGMDLGKPQKSCAISRGAAGNRDPQRNRRKALNARHRYDIVRGVAAGPALDWRDDRAVSRVVVVATGGVAPFGRGDLRRLYILGRAVRHEEALILWRAIRLSIRTIRSATRNPMSP